MGRLMWLLEGTRGVEVCNLVDLFEHSLQTASRAARSGADPETVVCALFHDVGEVLNHVNHGEIAASLLRPYISERNYWVLQHHEIFQTQYYGAACGVDPNLRDSFKSVSTRLVMRMVMSMAMRMVMRMAPRSSPHYSACEQFCRDWDMTSFDPEYKSMELDE